MIFSKPYAELSKNYRSLMDHVDYSFWGNYLEKILQINHAEPKSMLELGAGTGLLAKYFKPKSLELRISSDLSLEMISIANKKDSGFLVCANAKEMPFKYSFDLMLMTYDAINYLNKKALQQFFKFVFQNLSDQGLFLFDASTEYNSLEFFDDCFDVLETKNEVIQRHSFYDFKKKIQYNEFDFFKKQKNGFYSRSKEHHEQFIYSKEEFETLLNQNNLKIKDVYTDFSFSRKLKNASRLQFVVVKG